MTSPAVVAKIRAELLAGKTQREIARLYRVGAWLVADISRAIPSDEWAKGIMIAGAPAPILGVRHGRKTARYVVEAGQRRSIVFEYLKGLAENEAECPTRFEMAAALSMTERSLSRSIDVLRDLSLIRCEQMPGRTRWRYRMVDSGKVTGWTRGPGGARNRPRERDDVGSMPDPWAKAMNGRRYEDSEIFAQIGLGGRARMSGADHRFSLVGSTASLAAI